MKQLPLTALPSLFAAVSAGQKLYIPADDDAGQASFTVWQEGLTLTKKLNTVRSAKDLFFPQVENLVGFRVTGKQLDLVETRDPAEPFVLFGVRATRGALRSSTASSLQSRRTPITPPGANTAPSSHWPAPAPRKRASVRPSASILRPRRAISAAGSRAKRSSGRPTRKRARR